MSSSFTPTTVVDMSKEKDWPVGLGMLDWDSTSIVFTKRSLIEFLKYTGTTVDTNFANIQKLPRYAKFGKLGAPGSAEPLAPTPAATESKTSGPSTRRSNTGPVTDIFGGDFTSNGDALSMAPPKPESEEPPVPVAPEPAAEAEPEEEQGLDFTSHVKPSRRVREQPGGQDSLSNFWDADPSPAEFKPSRRVRQGPGGQDHVSDLF